MVGETNMGAPRKMTTPSTVLNMPDEKYKFLMKTLESFKGGIRMLGMNPLYKQSLMRDIHTMESILKGGKNGQIVQQT